MSVPDEARVAPAGDAALVVQFTQRIDPGINARAMALARALQNRWGAILRDVVVAYCSVTVYFDPIRVDGRWLESELEAMTAETRDAPAAPGAVVDVPVCYEGELAPDLERVAAFGRCSPEEVVALHTGRTYRVYMMGFAPGFAYLAEVDARIAAPRLPTPRLTVPAGAVGIAGPQTGIYPLETPGGWNIIGRTALKPYDPQRGTPFLLRPGDSVQFVSIPYDAFEGQA